MIKFLSKKNQAVAPVFLQNENSNGESNISLANNKKIRKPKISTENEHHRVNSSTLAKENNEDKKNMLKNTLNKKYPDSGRFCN